MIEITGLDTPLGILGLLVMMMIPAAVILLLIAACGRGLNPTTRSKIGRTGGFLAVFVIVFVDVLALTVYRNGGSALQGLIALVFSIVSTWWIYRSFRLKTK